MRSRSSPHAALPPAFAHWTVRALSGEHTPACLRAAEESRSLLVAEGWSEPDELARGAAPRAAEADADIELGEWRHGWQRHASRTRNLFFRDHVLLPSLPPASRAMLRSQAGPHAGAWLTAIPSDRHTSLAPDVMLIALRRRLRLPLPLAPATCGDRDAPGCGQRSDALGDQCPLTGLVGPTRKSRRAGVVLSRP